MLACAATLIPPRPKEARSSPTADARQHADPANCIVCPSGNGKKSTRFAAPLSRATAWLGIIAAELGTKLRWLCPRPPPPLLILGRPLRARCAASSRTTRAWLALHGCHIHGLRPARGGDLRVGNSRGTRYGGGWEYHMPGSSKGTQSAMWVSVLRFGSGFFPVAGEVLIWTGMLATFAALRFSATFVSTASPATFKHPASASNAFSSAAFSYASESSESSEAEIIDLRRYSAAFPGPPAHAAL
ncbi:hypothetical protein DFH09DRAFT_1316461 [Mycena vulgaris]|nr:hypothetical protein DFH09DRAFT_1316461 [Mycena vulgaris]